jgi:hypothetical protein
MDIVERLRYWAFKFCGKGEREDIASDAMTDGWQEIERLREALKWAIKDCDAKTNHETIKRELLEALKEKE